MIQLNIDVRIDDRIKKLHFQMSYTFAGDITWREFHIQFLMAKGNDQKKAEQHMEDYETIPLEPDGESVHLNSRIGLSLSFSQAELFLKFYVLKGLKKSSAIFRVALLSVGYDYCFLEHHLDGLMIFH